MKIQKKKILGWRGLGAWVRVGLGGGVRVMGTEK